MNIFKNLSNAGLQEGNESNAHVRLENELRKCAYQLGYQYDYEGFPENKIPDVLQHNGNRYLFMGDAKVSRNETVGRADSAKQISGYIDVFIKLMRDKKINGGFVAIITDDKKAANEWKSWLSAECKKKGLKYIASTYDDEEYYNEYIAKVSIIALLPKES